MFDHVGMIVSDAARSLHFYGSSLEPLGLTITQRHPGGAFIVAPRAGGASFLYVGPDAPEFWDAGHRPGRSPVHICFAAPSVEAVDTFHQRALAAGGTDNGAPGERHRHYYAAYVLDPDGNNIEAAYHGA
ncbi:MAG: VOC family protein [Acuticoccus sp.]